MSYGAQQAAVSFRKGHQGLGNLLTLALQAFTVSTSSSVTPADWEDLGDAEESSSEGWPQHPGPIRPWVLSEGDKSQLRLQVFS